MKAVVNLAKMPTGDIVRRRDADLAIDNRLAAIAGVLDQGALTAVDANALSERLMGDTVYANVVMLGFAWQLGLVPVSHEALRQAIDLNGVATEANHRAFLIGRVAAAKPDALTGFFTAKPTGRETLDQIVSRREAFLTDYQDADYAARYRDLVERVRDAEAQLHSDKLTRAVAVSLFKLMAYKDEYEVARLHTQTGLTDRLKAQFEGDFKIVHHLAPPVLNAGRDARGRPLKRAFGSWIRVPFHVLARLKRIRGTAFDPFGYTDERRMERELIGWYEARIEEALARLSPATHDQMAEIMALPMQIRGFGPVKHQAVTDIRPKLDAAFAAL